MVHDQVEEHPHAPLAPTYSTPNRDDGYDITDYYGIDKRLGSSGDFAEFLFEADGLGDQFGEFLEHDVAQPIPRDAGTESSGKRPHSEW